MCNYRSVKNSDRGYVMRCSGCGHIQVAFASTILSFTRDQFYDFINMADELYKSHNMHPFPDEKIIRIPTPARAVTLAYSVNEMKDFLYLLIDGRNKFEHADLFSFNHN